MVESKDLASDFRLQRHQQDLQQQQQQQRGSARTCTCGGSPCTCTATGDGGGPGPIIQLESRIAFYGNYLNHG